MAQLFAHKFHTEEPCHNKSYKTAVLSLIIWKWIMGSASAGFSPYSENVQREDENTTKQLLTPQKVNAWKGVVSLLLTLNLPAEASKKANTFFNGSLYNKIPCKI